MSNPLSPLSSSFQNARARSPKIGSSPFLTRTLDEPTAQDAVPSSPLKQTWTDRDAQNPIPSYANENENYIPDDEYHGNNEYDDADDFQEPASSPFRNEAREDTVDFKRLQEYQQTSTTTPRRNFEAPELNDRESSPFRPDARDETVDFQRLREVQPLSPSLDKRLAVENPASSPFRPNLRDEAVDSPDLREVPPLSPDLDNRFTAEDPASSPFRPDARDETVDFAKLREVQRLSPDVGEEPVHPESSPFRANVQEDMPESDDIEPQPQEEIEAPRLSIGRVERSPPVEAYSSPLKAEAEEDVQQDDVEPEELPQESPQPTAQIKHSSPIDKQDLPLRYDNQKDSIQGIDSPKELQKPPRESIGSIQSPTPIISKTSPCKQKSPEEQLEVQKLRSSRRSLHRSSLGLDGLSATPRKRSFDETPRGQEEAQAHSSHKKGMVSRSENPDIHVELDEESSVIHNESSLSMTSTTQDRSTIANSIMEDKRNEGMSTVLHEDENAGPDEQSVFGDDYHDSMDETGLSTFSVLPDMTSFAKLRAESPLKSMVGSAGPSSAHRADMYRRSVGGHTPSTAQRGHRVSALLDNDSPTGTPTPRRRASRDIQNPRATPNLLDFGDSVNFFPHQSMQQNGRYSPSRRSPMRPMRQSIRSPSKFSSLLDLDFDVAPAPTPRSLPSITPRELESLKSGFMSEISSLKATLSGKDAEVASLKTAISDAERRVGEALEEVRNEAARREALEIEQAEWDRRGNEMENVLRSVRSELVEGERERERLARKAEEAEKGKEQLEGRVVEIESQLSAARSAAPSESSTASSSRQASQSAEATAREVQDAVEKVARELHTLYKGKHETKVAALKKSYETRWEKRLREAEKKLSAAKEENDRLRSELNAAQSDGMANANASMMARENDEHEAEKRVFEAQIKGLQHEMASLKEDSDRLRSDLKLERAEKGELVAAVDEWLAIQQTQPPPPQQQQETREPSVSSTGHGEEYLSSNEAPTEHHRRSVSRSGSSGIRAPVTGEKRRFGAPSGHSRGNSGGKSGIAVFTPGRGGIMSSIERMGRGGA